MRWDIFCRVIDNHGDLGVCWRLARQLADAGEAPRLWVDDGAALDWMAPQRAGVEVVDWSDPAAEEAALAAPAPDVLVEAFGCNPRQHWSNASPPGRAPRIRAPGSTWNTSPPKRTSSGCTPCPRRCSAGREPG